jgi:hypothetical protein
MPDALFPCVRHRSQQAKGLSAIVFWDPEDVRDDFVPAAEVELIARGTSVFVTRDHAEAKRVLPHRAMLEPGSCTMYLSAWGALVRFFGHNAIGLLRTLTPIAA